MKDANGKRLTPGDIINIYQTVNGQSMFVVASLEPLDIRYHYDMSRVYEYDMAGLLEEDPDFGVDWEIVDHIDPKYITPANPIAHTIPNDFKELPAWLKELWEVNPKLARQAEREIDELKKKVADLEEAAYLVHVEHDKKRKLLEETTERVRELETLSSETVRLLNEFSEDNDEDSGSKSYIHAHISGDWFFDLKDRLQTKKG